MRALASSVRGVVPVTGNFQAETALNPLAQEALLAAYKAKYEASEPTREWNASHILVTTREEADDLVKALEAGADFAALAQEKSTGPSGPNGGDLGWFGPGMMVPPLKRRLPLWRQARSALQSKHNLAGT